MESWTEVGLEYAAADSSAYCPNLRPIKFLENKHGIVTAETK